MHVYGSSRSYLSARERRTLARMARREVEEGETSDGDSLEEITAEDFKHDARGSRSRVWMTEMMRYPVSRNFAPDLYSFAWAQAVQNKPLRFGHAAKEDAVIVEAEKEEGELEEGEIELGSEPPVADGIHDSSSSKPDGESEVNESAEKEPEENKSEEMSEFDKRVSLILEDLETVTKEEAEASLEAVCARLRKSFESLKQMFSESRVPVLDALVHQAFMGMQTVLSVVSSSYSKKNEDLLLKLLIHIKNQYSILLTPEQSKELDSMVLGLASSDNNGGNMNGYPSHGLVSSEKPCQEPRAVNYIVSNSGKAGLPKLETPIVDRNRMEFSLLLDLHADYDEGSLPSPTREGALTLPMLKPINFGMGAVMPAQMMLPKNVEAGDFAFQPYDTDFFQAVSSYQQKHSQTSFVASNLLPSPTPSEESNDNDDTHGEISSSPVVDNASLVNSSSSSQILGSSSSGACTAWSSGFQTAPVRTVGQLGLGPIPVVKAPAKSRDPRFRILNPEMGGAPDPNRLLVPVDSNTPNVIAGGLMNLGKHKAVDEAVLDDRTLKRQRNGVANSRDVQMTLEKGGWLEERSFVTSQPSDRNVEVEIRKPGNGKIVSNRIQDAGCNFNGMNDGIGQNPSTSTAPAVSTSTAPAVSLPSLLKDIAVNPAVLMQLIQMEQQRLAAQAQQKTADSAHDSTVIPRANRLPGTVSAANSASLKSSDIEQNSAGKPHLPVQTVNMNSQNDVGRIRMKPRDPRRILHNNMVQKSESLKPEPTKINGNLASEALSSKDRVTVREQGDQTQTADLPSQPAPQPDITRLFTKILQNPADVISISQLINTSLAAPQNTSQPIPSNINKVDVKPTAADFNCQKTVSGWPSEGGTTGDSQPPNPWGDVDHLLDGYDDQQKVAIQRERSRRIEEQNKMFAARKLCLVLDLDHTLLNSAKFIEVDPVHDEILRKKEEQDHEKPERHLFRFQHMGMWTKLRPGIWNFLERASQLYELHLYTMGNKLYATEMAKVLDPTGTLFAGRVISRGDDSDPFDGDERVPKSKDLEGVLGMESAVVIIDDSVRVWPHNKLNLIAVERYTYFPCSRRQFGLPGPSLLEIDHDERPDDGTLASSLSVIERIHHNFFSYCSLNDVDVRNILAAEQQKILAGCRIVFSRIFPVGEANPHLHPLWQAAEQFGAVCTNQIDEQVTHVVANSLGTDKVNWALSTGRFVVQPGWVEASALLYRRANELDFTVKI